MVEVVQLVERKIVVLVVAGSIPVLHPKYRDIVQLVVCVLWEHEVAGSSPAIPTTWCLKHLGDVSDCESEEEGSNPSLHPNIMII